MSSSDPKEPRDQARRRAAVRTRAAVALAALLLLVDVVGLGSMVSARWVGGSASWMLPAVAATIAALLGLASEREGWPPRRVLATVVAAAGLAARLGVAWLVSPSLGGSGLEVAGASALLDLAAVAWIDRRGGDRGQLVLAWILWTGAVLAVGGGGLVWLYLGTHELGTVL